MDAAPAYLHIIARFHEYQRPFERHSLINTCDPVIRNLLGEAKIGGEDIGHLGWWLKELTADPAEWEPGCIPFP